MPDRGGDVVKYVLATWLYDRVVARYGAAYAEANYIRNTHPDEEIPDART